MAWTHFTDWLTAGQLPTKDMRDEILDAFVERLLALDGPAHPVTVDTSALADFKASRLPHQRITYSAQIGDGLEEEPLDRTAAHMILELRYISRHYVRDPENGYWYWTGELIDDQTTVDDLIQDAKTVESGNILWQAAQDLGYTQTEFEDLFAGSQGRYPILQLPSHHLWNLLRRTIMLMEWHRLGSTTGSSGWTNLPSLQDRFSKSVSSEATWEDAKAAHEAVSEASVVTLGNAVFNTSFSFAIETVRGAIPNAYIPEITTHDSYSMRVWVQVVRADKTGVHVVCGLGSPDLASASEVMSSSAHHMPVTCPSQTDQGETSVHLAPLAHYDPSDYDIMQPGALDVFNMSANLRTLPSDGFGDDTRSAIVRPEWTHPAEEI